jgi:rfaE bifunctional protein kinase chain/domain
VPQELRALNLAAFEMVDYVVVDENAKPIENIATIQPDFFAKGFEYNPDEKLNPKTQEEIDTIEAYGGSVIFTPGDIVYSSSSLINMAPPQIKTEKLLSAMERSNVSFDDLRARLKGMAGKHVHVIGDTIVDSYTYCTMIGGQTKTPTMSVLFERKVDYIGGAAVVAKHMQAAGAEVVFSTVLGDDANKDFVLKGLKDSGVDVRAVIDPTRPTVNKNAIVAENYRLLKVDTLDNRSISDDILGRLASAISGIKSEAIVFSDFRHGIFNRRTIPVLCEAIPANVFKVADSQVASRWGNITEFQNFDLITPNEREARFALADQDSNIVTLSGNLLQATRCNTLILKLGSRGVVVSNPSQNDEGDLGSFIVVDSFADSVVDAVGAGDALLAYATLTKLSGGDDVTATILGSMAAACECEFDGNIPVSPENVLAKIDAVERQVHFF